MKKYPNQWLHLELGKDYWCGWAGYKPTKVRLIKTTKMGYNLLNLETNKVFLMGSHIYPKKNEKKLIFPFYSNLFYITPFVEKK